MAPCLTATPELHYLKLGDLKPGTWALARPPGFEVPSLIPVLCLERLKNESEDTTRLLVFGGDSPGSHMVYLEEAGALVLCGVVDAKFEPETLNEGKVPDLKSTPSIAIGISSDGLLLLYMQHTNDPKFDGPRAITLQAEDIKSGDTPSRIAWTRHFTLRVQGREDGEWVTIFKSD